MWSSHFFTALGKDACLVKQMATEWAKERKKMELRVLYGGVYTLSLSKLESLAVPSLAWQQINLSSLFSCSLSPHLGIEIFNLFLFACVTTHELAFSLEQEGRQCKKEMRAHWSLVHLGVTFCHSKLEHLTSDHRLISHSAILPTQIIIWLYLESEHSWFSPASLLLLWCERVSGCTLLLVTGGRIVWVWLSFLCAIKTVWGIGEMAYFLIPSLTVQQILMTNCIILAFTSTFTPA